MLDRNKLPWFYSDDIRPYVYVRRENQVKQPGSRHKVDWFTRDPLFVDPLKMSEVHFANEILNLESNCFAASGMPMARWVFYDCAVMPGFVAGFAMRRSAMPKSILDIIKPVSNNEWLPVSLFIIIPSMHVGEWIAHNLCSVNSLIPKADQMYGLGFLTKAFGLWYANVKVQSGMTQWTSPSLKLHCHYGRFEVLTAFTPVHSYAHTLTYRAIIDPTYWPYFFKNQGEDLSYAQGLKPAGFTIEPRVEKSLVSFQERLERNEGPFFLNASEILELPLGAELMVYEEE